MRRALALAGVLTAALMCGNARAAETTVREEYVHVPMPPGFQVQYSELDGPVFADPAGHTLYNWPYDQLRNGATGDPKNASACTDQVSTKTAGLMSPYPPGLTLPDLDKRLSCVATWPPAYAADDAQPVGKFTIFTRKDGKKQWAYDDLALYTSILDHAPGDTMGGADRRSGGDGPAERHPVGPPAAVPPGFTIVTTVNGRMVVTEKNMTLYTSDKDGVNKSNCDLKCTAVWEPVLAPATALPQGQWSAFERAPGVRQWAYRGKPLYTYTPDPRIFSMDGSDVPGWHLAYAQLAPPAPAEFTRQDSEIGVVLADHAGKTIYVYNCGDDSVDQLACDTPDSPQVYRLAICGGGDVNRCLKMYPYVVAGPNAKSTSRTWTILNIDPMTGRLAAPGQAGALRVWGYRDRPVYTFAGDQEPGNITGNDRGEFTGKRNGFKAFILRDEYFGER